MRYFTKEIVLGLLSAVAIASPAPVYHLESKDKRFEKYGNASDKGYRDNMGEESFYRSDDVSDAFMDAMKHTPFSVRASRKADDLGSRGRKTSAFLLSASVPLAFVADAIVTPGRAAAAIVYGPARGLEKASAAVASMSRHHIFALENDSYTVSKAVLRRLLVKSRALIKADSQSARNLSNSNITSLSKETLPMWLRWINAKEMKVSFFNESDLSSPYGDPQWKNFHHWKLTTETTLINAQNLWDVEGPITEDVVAEAIARSVQSNDDDTVAFSKIVKSGIDFDKIEDQKARLKSLGCERA